MTSYKHVKSVAVANVHFIDISIKCCQVKQDTINLPIYKCRKVKIVLKSEVRTSKFYLGDQLCLF